MDWVGLTAPNQDDSALVAGCILRHAFLHALQLFGRRFALIFGFPFGGGHTVDEFAGLFLGERAVRLHHPVGEAIAAKSSEAHQVDILGIVPVLQMRDEAAEGCCCGGVRNLLFIVHSYAPFR
jgi:hypothetical protein